jgi:hypothetical protein
VFKKLAELTRLFSCDVNTSRMSLKSYRPSLGDELLLGCPYAFMKRAMSPPSWGRPVGASSSAVAVCCTDRGNPLGLNSAFLMIPEMAKKKTRATKQPQAMPANGIHRGALLRPALRVTCSVGDWSGGSNGSGTMLGGGKSLFIEDLSLQLIYAS